MVLHQAFSACVRLADVHADGEYKLLVADSDRKLKVYKGFACLLPPPPPSFLGLDSLI